jgi:hypothetical protein
VDYASTALGSARKYALRHHACSVFREKRNAASATNENNEPPNFACKNNREIDWSRGKGTSAANTMNETEKQPMTKLRRPLTAVSVTRSEETDVDPLLPAGWEIRRMRV